jgi:hypothetical protein
LQAGGHRFDPGTLHEERPWKRAFPLPAEAARQVGTVLVEQPMEQRTGVQRLVPGTLPVLFFGLLTAEVASGGLKPSDQEYLSKGGAMLSGAAQRFATLAPSADGGNAGRLAISAALASPGNRRACPQPGERRAEARGRSK